MGEMDSDERQPGHRDSAASAPAMVVGLGASAGGIKALNTFFTHVPADAPFAYVVILHLSPDYDSRLAEVLQTATALPVNQVTDRIVLAPRHVYVIPPNQTLSVVEHRLTLKPFARPEERRTPVDMFFRTLADAYGSRAAAVVLSGTGPNGSSGLKRVKEHGGLTIAQDPAEAEYGDMPQNSVATGLVDFILPAAEIPLRIVRYQARLMATPGATMDPAGGDIVAADDHE